MANTFTLCTQAVTWAAGKNMLAIQNHTGSTVILSIYRIWLFNTTASATGGNGLLQLWSYTSVASFTGGSAQTFIKHDTNGASLPSEVSANSATSTVLTKNVLLRQIIRSNDEPAANAATTDELGTSFPPLNCIWDSAYGESTLQPLVLRAGEGFVLFTPSTGGGTYAGQTDICVELTSV